MTNSEFSDTFSTLLNSFNTQANFGDQASKREIVLDEYEKSVLLTQAQDIVVKSYFDGTLNPQGQGFDDSTRRQVDFSSLIKVASLSPNASPYANTFDSRGVVFDMPEDALFILNEKLVVNATAVAAGYWWKGETTSTGDYSDAKAATLPKATGSYTGINDAEADGWKYVATHQAQSKEYVIVPISYKEYDREMSKPFSQPLKKQAWRLFQNKSTGFDMHSEVIPKHSVPTEDVTKLAYKMRYVRRPSPIILEALPDGLEIDGVSTASECELNPILHYDILNKAVEIAIATRGGSTAAPREQRQTER